MKESEPSGTFLFPDTLYEGYIFDLDGTIYLGDNLSPGAKCLIEKLRELGRKVVFLSNNPTKAPKMYAEKLTKLGIPTLENQTVNTVVAMTQYCSCNTTPKRLSAPSQKSPLSVRSRRPVSGCRKEPRR